MRESGVFAVILAGGRGKRFWPKSRMKSPKQLLPIVNDRPMIEQTIDRILPIISPGNILIVTSDYLVESIRCISPGIPQENYIEEPVGRNTAPAIALAAAHARLRNPDAILVVLASDHVIGDVEEFRAIIKDATALSKAKNYIITLGIRPTHPETGFGYLEISTEQLFYNARRYSPVTKFVEKPDAKTAQSYVESGRYLWNSGMFVFSARKILEEIAYFQPELYDGIQKIIYSSDPVAETNKIFPMFPDLSIDYAVMEKTSEIYAFPLDIGWSDVGSWLALYNHLPDLGHGNRSQSEQIMIECNDTLIHAQGRLIAAVGLNDIIIVDTPDATLICHKSKTQLLNDVVKKLSSKAEWKKYL